MPEFESTDEEEERAGTTHQQARDQDAERKQRGAENANKRAADSDVSEGDKVLLMKQRQNKLSATYDPEPYSVVSKRGDLVIIEQGENLLERNIGHVERFIDHEPGASQSKQGLAQTPEQTPVVEPVVYTYPKQILGPAERPTTEPADGSAIDLGSLLLIGCPNRLLHLEGPVKKELSLVGLKTMSPGRLSETDLLRIVT